MLISCFYMASNEKTKQICEHTKYQMTKEKGNSVSCFQPKYVCRRGVVQKNMFPFLNKHTSLFHFPFFEISKNIYFKSDGFQEVLPQMLSFFIWFYKGVLRFE